MSIVIREYDNNDFEFVKNILFEAFPEVNDLLEKSMTTSKTLNLDKNKYIQLVAEEEGKVVGYALASRSSDPVLIRTNLWIDYVCVNSEHRGKGIAKQLMKRIEEIAIEEKVLFLQLTSSRFRTGARKLYMDMGFTIRESDIFRKVLEW